MEVFAGLNLRVVRLHAPYYETSLAMALGRPNPLGFRLPPPERDAAFVDIDAMALRDVFQHVIHYFLDVGQFPWTDSYPWLEKHPIRKQVRELTAMLLSPTRDSEPRIQAVRAASTADTNTIGIIQRCLMWAAGRLSELRLVAKCFSDSRQLLYHGWRDIHVRVHAVATLLIRSGWIHQSARPTYFPLTKSPAHFEAQGEWFRAAVAWMFYPWKPRPLHLQVVDTARMDGRSCFYVHDLANPVPEIHPSTADHYYVVQAWDHHRVVTVDAFATSNDWLDFLARNLQAPQRWRAQRAALEAIVQARGMPWRRPPTKRKAEDMEEGASTKRPRT